MNNIFKIDELRVVARNDPPAGGAHANQLALTTVVSSQQEAIRLYLDAETYPAISAHKNLQKQLRQGIKQILLSIHQEYTKYTLRVHLLKPDFFQPK